MLVKQQYPKMVYHSDGIRTHVAKTPEEEERLGDGWSAKQPPRPAAAEEPGCAECKKLRDKLSALKDRAEKKISEQLDAMQKLEVEADSRWQELEETRGTLSRVTAEKAEIQDASEKQLKHIEEMRATEVELNAQIASMKAAEAAVKAAETPVPASAPRRGSNK